jgi:hypothetical protein
MHFDFLRIDFCGIQTGDQQKTADLQVTEDQEAWLLTFCLIGEQN